MHKEDTTVLVTLRDTFEGATLTSLEWKGRPCWVAGEIDTALGLGDKLSSSRWARRSKDYREGADGEQITGAELDALKAAGLVDANATAATVFYESGATLYLMASRAQKARAFRWHLVDVVLPQLRERAVPKSDPRIALLDAAGTDHERWAIVLTTEDSRERHALWKAATELRKVEIKAADRAYVVEQERRRIELLQHRRLLWETNQKERRQLQAKLLRAMEAEIVDRRSNRRPVRYVERLEEKVSACILDEKVCAGSEPAYLRTLIQ